MYDGKLGSGEQSILFDSPLYSHITNVSFDIVSDCLYTFENESAALLRLSPYSESKSVPRMEMIRPFIVKVLIYLGLTPLCESFAVLTRLIELLALDDDATFDKAIAICARSCGSVETVNKAIEHQINMYDGKFVERLCSLTDTSPLSPRDAIFDIAMYIKNEYFGRMSA